MTEKMKKLRSLQTQRGIQTHRTKHKPQRGKNNHKIKHPQTKGHKKCPRRLKDQTSARYANSIGMVIANSEQNAARNTRSSARNSPNTGYYDTTKTAVTVSAANYTPMRAEPHSERENVTGKAAGSTTSDVQKTHSNLAPRVGGERERKKNGEKNPEQADKVQGGILREEKKQRQRTRFFSKASKP